MKSSKGQSKALARFLDSEYYDYSLEPLDQEKGLDFLSKINLISNSKLEGQNAGAQPEHIETTEEELLKKVKQSHKSHYNVTPNTIISGSLIKDVVERLGDDAKSCYYGLQEFRNIEGTDVAKNCEDLYNIFDTIPIIFLSLDKDKEGLISTVYLWQLNRFSPWNRSRQQLLVDLHFQYIDLYPYPSFVMLLKIMPQEGETIISAKLLADGNALVESRIQDSQVIFRIYKTCDFTRNAKLNPYNIMTDRKNEYSAMILLERGDISNKSDWKVALYRSRTNEELDLTLQTTVCEDTQLNAEINEKSFQVVSKDILVSSKVLQDSSNFSEKDLLKNLILNIIDDETILFDKTSLQIIKFTPQDLQVISLRSIGIMKSFQFTKESFYVINKENKVFELNLLKEFNEKVLQYRRTLPLEDLLPNADAKWQVIPLVDAELNRQTDHGIFLRDNKIYALPLDGSKRGLRILANLKGNNQSLTISDWNIYLHNQKLEDMVIERTPILVYLIENSLHFYDTTSEKSKTVDVIISDISIRPTYKIIKATTGYMYLYSDGQLFSTESVVEVKFPDNLSDLFSISEVEGDITTTILCSSNTSTTSSLEHAQLEDDAKRISLIRFKDCEPFYKDEANLTYLAKNAFQILQKQKQNNQKNVNAEQKMHLTPKTNDEEIKQDDTWRVIQKAKNTKKILNHVESQQETIAKCDEALSDIRKEIKAQASKIFKQNEDLLKASQKRYETLSNPYSYYNHYSQNDTTVTQKSSGVEQTKIQKEYLQSYNDLKSEKKKAAKQREKEKAKKQNWKQTDGEF